MPTLLKLLPWPPASLGGEGSSPTPPRPREEELGWDRGCGGDSWTGHIHLSCGFCFLVWDSGCSLGCGR